MKTGKRFLFFVLVLSITGGIAVLERNVMKKKTYGYYKESLYETEEKEAAPLEENSGSNQCWKPEGDGILEKVLAEQTVETKAEEKKVFLTFDDGPSQITERVLSLLDGQDIKATFFLIGEQITEEMEPLVKRMSEEGHEIGIHTYTHEKDQIYSSAQAYIEDVMKTSDRIEEVTGKKPVYYRFPWGSVNPYICSFRKEVIEGLAAMGYQYIDWNVSGEDSVGNPTVQSIYNNVKKDYDRFCEPVVLMHDSPSNERTVETLPDIIKLFQEAGYGFGRIRERSCPYQWCKN